MKIQKRTKGPHLSNCTARGSARIVNQKERERIGQLITKLCQLADKLAHLYKGGQFLLDYNKNKSHYKQLVDRARSLLYEISHHGLMDRIEKNKNTAARYGLVCEWSKIAI